MFKIGDVVVQKNGGQSKYTIMKVFPIVKEVEIMDEYRHSLGRYREAIFELVKPAAPKYKKNLPEWW